MQTHTDGSNDLEKWMTRFNLMKYARNFKESIETSTHKQQRRSLVHVATGPFTSVIQMALSASWELAQYLEHLANIWTPNIVNIMVCKDDFCDMECHL